MAGIGGYFELALPRTEQPHPRALKFQSGRAAFASLLAVGRPRRVWMPYYICDAMLSPLAAAGIEVAFYGLADDFSVSGDLQLEPGEWLLYVNYFGINSGNVEALLSRFNPEQVVIDNSQAFFDKPREAALATIYSPRKFFGLPDGGLLYSKLPIPLPAEQDHESLDCMQHLLKRLALGPEAGYPAYLKGEQRLCDFRPRGMSALTERLLESQDFAGSRVRRNSNFSFLHRELKRHNLFRGIDSDAVDAPLCYSFLTDRGDLRQKLIEQRIFIPTYWPEVLSRVVDRSFESCLVQCCLPIPCDQRYGEQEMARICAGINMFLSRD